MSLWVPTGHPLTSNRTLEAEEDLAKGHCRDSCSIFKCRSFITIYLCSKNFAYKLNLGIQTSPSLLLTHMYDNVPRSRSSRDYTMTSLHHSLSFFFFF